MLIWVSNKNRQRSNSSKSSKNSSNESLEKASSQKLTTNLGKQKKKYEQLKKIEDVTKKMSKSKKENYQNSINLQQFVSQNFSLKRVKEYYQQFCKYDQDEDGLLSLMQFENMIRQSGYSLNMGSVKDMFKQIKQKRRNQIRFQDFIDILNVQDCTLDSKKQIQKIFRSFDKKNRGVGFDFQDYFIVSKTLNQQFSLEELQEAFDLMDENKDGLVSLEQFRNAMNKTYSQRK